MILLLEFRPPQLTPCAISGILKLVIACSIIWRAVTWNLFGRIWCALIVSERKGRDVIKRAGDFGATISQTTQYADQGSLWHLGSSGGRPR